MLPPLEEPGMSCSGWRAEQEFGVCSAVLSQAGLWRAGKEMEGQRISQAARAFLHLKNWSADAAYNSFIRNNTSHC